MTTHPQQTSTTVVSAESAAPTMKVFHHPDSNATGLRRETVRKGDEIASSLTTRPIDGVAVVTARPATTGELSAVHTHEYLDALRTGSPRRLAESNGIGWDEKLFDAVRASTGALRDAALDALATGGVAGALSSGLHHARAGHGSGFCTVNGLVVAARAALDAGARRVLILDLDAHCGGGTASLIAGLDGVEQVDVSVNRFDWYESRPDARLVLSGGFEYQVDIEWALGEIDDPSSIDLILYNAGMDAHRDAGGDRHITDPAIRDREALVFAWAQAIGAPVAWTLAGGYTVGVDMAGLVDLHRITIEAAVNEARR